MPDADTPVNTPPAPVTADLACPECAARVPPDRLDAHLRRAHGVYLFRGVRRSLNDTLTTLLNLLSSPADADEAWPVLEAIAREELGGHAEAFLASSAGQALGRAAASDGAVASAARAIARGDVASRLLPLLAAEPEAHARHLALRLAAQLPPPLDGAALAAVRSVLPDKNLPLDAVLAAADALVQTTGKEGPYAARVYLALIDGWGKSRGIDRLDWLERRVGPSATLDALRTQLKERQRLSCPRCGVELRRPQMAEHLWQEHRLVLDGVRVREAWSAVEHWVKDIADAPGPQSAELLERCRDVARRADGEDGLARLHRMLLARGVGDEETRQALLADAAAVGASLCPHCFARVPVPLRTPPRALNVWHGRVSGFGYRVEVGDRGLFTRLEIETPAGTLYRGPESGRRLTRSGATLFLAGPPVLLAAAISLGQLPPLVPVTLLLAAALTLAVYVRLTWRKPRPALDRAVDIAWREVAPRLHEAGYSQDDAAFAAALAWTSLQRGRPAVRAPALQRLLALTEKAVASGHAAAEHLADLHRLAIDDAVAAGEDPVLLVVGQAERCFEGKLALSYLERLLAGWESGWWTTATLVRLKVLLCDRAFEAGFEVANLLEAGQAVPTLGAVLETEDPDGLARLRLLWSMRARQPWDRCGPAVTVFELAEWPGKAHYLSRHPDLLLLQEPERGQPAEEGDELPILVCGRGVNFQGALFDRMPRELEVIELRGVVRGGFEVVVDDTRFWLRRDPDELADRLEQWFRFFFREFAPEVRAVHGWRSPGVAAALRARESVPCPECGRPVLPRAGQIGAALAE